MGQESIRELTYVLLIRKGLRNSVSGEDDDLKAAYADLGKALEQERRTVASATLVGVEQAKVGIEEVKKEGKDTHAHVKEGLEIGGRVEHNTAILVSEVQKLRLESERMEKLWQGRTPLVAS